MARTMWKGAIQFGLVSMPVGLSIATESRSVAFHLLHGACGRRIQMRTWCPEHDIAVTRAETVKGVEVAPDLCVPITDEDLEVVPLKTLREIVIEQFVPIAELGEATRFPKQTYYVRPELIARRACALFMSTLARRRVAAVCKIVLTNREQLALLRVFGDTLVLTTLHWPDEIREPDEKPDRETFSPAERAAAEALVGALSGSFDPAAHHDEYRDALLGVIERKVAGLPAPTVAADATGPLVDLMAVLEASVAAARASRVEPASLPAERVSERRAKRSPRVDETTPSGRRRGRRPRAAA